MSNAIKVTHNFDKTRFHWLYAKYACGCNPVHHCTNAIRGKYSKRFSKMSEAFLPGQSIILDEIPPNNWDAIYICGVSKTGYSSHNNYHHNVHVAILPCLGKKDHWSFENWRIDVENGVFEPIPSENDIDSCYLRFPDDYKTCRMFRWAVWHYGVDVKQLKNVFVGLLRQEGINYGKHFCRDMMSLKKDYKESVRDGSRGEFYEWIKESLRGGDVIHEQDFCWRKEESILALCHDFMEWNEISDAFEDGIETFIRRKLPHE